MATEASVTDQPADEHVEEMKVGDDIKLVDEERVSQLKDLEGASGEEKLREEGSSNMDASASKQEVKPEDKSETMVEEVKKEEAEVEPASDVIEKESESEAVEKPAVNTEACLVQELESEVAKEPAVSETVTEEVKTKELPEISASPVPASETEDKAAESPLESTVSEPENAQISQYEKISAEEAEVSPEPSKEEPSSDETPVLGTAVSESFDATAEVPAEVNEPEDAGAVIPEVSDVPDAKESVSGETEVSNKPMEVEEKVEKSVEGEEKVEKSVEGEEPPLSEATKTDAVTEVSSEVVGEEKIEEKSGESSEGDKTILADISQDLDAPTEVSEVSTEGEKASVGVEVVEEKDRSLEGDTTTVETSRDLDVDSTSKEPVSDSKEAELELKPAEAVQTETDKLVNEDAGDKKDESEKADVAKDGGDGKTEGVAPKQEVPAKPRQSNNIISKVKQSIVKVKKAIIGKSSSSKTMSSEINNDIKV